MKKILVPVDFSNHSEYALEVAATLAKKHDSDIVILHMLGLSEAVFTKDDSQEFMEAQFYMKLAKKRFNEFLDKSYLKGIKVTETVQYRNFRSANYFFGIRSYEYLTNPSCAMRSHNYQINVLLFGNFIDFTENLIVLNCFGNFYSL
jgi:hypothetical protein